MPPRHIAGVNTQRLSLVVGQQQRQFPGFQSDSRHKFRQTGDAFAGSRRIQQHQRIVSDNAPATITRCNARYPGA